MINLIFLAVMFGCQKGASLINANKLITTDYLYELNYSVWKDGYEVKVDALYELVKQIADRIDPSRLEQEQEILMKEKIAQGCNFFHLLFSLPLMPGDGHFDGFMGIFNKCFPSGKIPKEVAQSYTKDTRMNILHLAVLSGSTHIGKLILNSAEDASVLDAGDIEGESPLFLAVDKYIDASVEKGSKESKENYFELLELMLEKGFSLSRKNKVGSNFLTAVLNGFYNYPYDGKENSRKNKKGMSELAKLVGKLKKVAKKNEGIDQELDKVYDIYKDNLAERADKGILRKIDRALKK